MAYEMKVGQGSLFKNEKKEKETHPNLKGKVMLPNGEVRWVSAWTKKTKAGEPWISFAIGDVVAGGGMRPLDAHNTAKGNAFVAEVDDDIPF